jgi:hypothetical protein
LIQLPRRIASTHVFTSCVVTPIAVIEKDTHVPTRPIDQQWRLRQPVRFTLCQGGEAAVDARTLTQNASRAASTSVDAFGARHMHPVVSPELTQPVSIIIIPTESHIYDPGPATVVLDAAPDVLDQILTRRHVGCTVGPRKVLDRCPGGHVVDRCICGHSRKRAYVHRRGGRQRNRWRLARSPRRCPRYGSC